MNVAVPTAPPTTVSSSYQNFKRKLYAGKSETYDLAKVIDIVIKIHISLFKTPELINSFKNKIYKIKN
jgi:hypothetical protein